MSIRFGLLGLLSQASTHGYKLRAEFEAVTSDTWPLNIGQVYTTLRRLERDGLVASLDGGGGQQRRYELSGLGREQLHKWFATPVPRESPSHSELIIKVALSLALPDIDPQSVIDIERDGAMRRLQALIRAKAAASGDLSASVVADAVLFNAEAEIRWLKHCQDELVQLRCGRVIDEA